jgi:hypothetical protein
LTSTSKPPPNASLAAAIRSIARGRQVHRHRVHAVRQRAEVAGARDDADALVHEGLDDREPDPLARPGDDRLLARQMHVHARHPRKGGASRACVE